MNDLQKSELAIYKEVAQICARHHLRHYALGGTLLGAVRHQGFIPWDDDIDICLPRPDYDAFLQYAKTELPAHMVPTDYHSPNIERPTYFCVIKDINTRIDLNWADATEHGNVWIDVFPLDAMPSRSLLRKLKKYRLLYQRMMIQFSNYEVLVHQHRSNRPLHEKMLMRFHEMTGWGSKNDTCELYAQTEKLAKRKKYKHARYVVNLFGAYKFREMFPREWMGEAIWLPFEDTLMPCPQQYDRVLTQLYGDYMALPPDDQRGQQHCIQVISLDDTQSAAFGTKESL